MALCALRTARWQFGFRMDLPGWDLAGGRVFSGTSFRRLSALPRQVCGRLLGPKEPGYRRGGFARNSLPRPQPNSESVQGALQRFKVYEQSTDRHIQGKQKKSS